jgi:hypothetical protein
MQRIGKVLVIGWLLVLATAYVFPDLVYERHQLNLRSNADAARRILDGSLLREGWRLNRVIGASDNPLIYEIERSRLRLP